MIPFPIDDLAACFIVLAIGIIIGLSFFYDYCEGRYYARRCTQSLFYCKKCNCIFSVNEEVELYECPKCGARNGRLKF